MTTFKSIADIRREYGELTLNETSIVPNPFAQFKIWFEEVLQVEVCDPTAMVLSTVDQDGFPDSRVVLLKGIENEGFIFYTNYLSAKGKQLLGNSHAALNFYWPKMARQVRIRGLAEKITKEQSDSYFSTRPFQSQIGAVISPQSQNIPNREYLEQAINKIIQERGEQAIQRPQTWGGFKIVPQQIEFWQGRNNRLHDRILYCRQGVEWVINRLAP